MGGIKSILAFDCGGTTTRAGLYTADKVLLREAASGPSNPSDLSVKQSLAVLEGLGRQVLGTNLTPNCIAAGVAGAVEGKAREYIARELCHVFEAQHSLVANDLLPLLLANAGSGDGIAVIAGTGSGVLAQSSEGRRLGIGGRGSLIGDEGSAYRLALLAIRSCAQAVDGLEPETALYSEILMANGFSTFADLCRWANHAGRHEIARLAETVLACGEREDHVALACLKEQAHSLARQASIGRERLNLPSGTPVFLSGGLFEHSPLYRSLFEKALEEMNETLLCSSAPLLHHRAVLELAFHGFRDGDVSLWERSEKAFSSLPPTERKLGKGKNLDQLSPLDIVRLMNEEDSTVHKAVAQEEALIAKAIENIAHALASGGRLIYAGAGTSGRLGVLDASECPPTFGVSPDRVLALIAGGDEAIRTSIEGAEDDRQQAFAAIAALDPPVTGKDVVVGIAASGTTPYVRAALERAASLGAKTALVCCNPACRDAAPLVIAMDTGPEVLAGSTRLKAGTATKMVLNMLTTGGMALSGQLYDELMVEMQPASAKLRRRAIRIVTALTGVEIQTAEKVLDKVNYHVAAAVLMIRKKLEPSEAAALLDRHGSLRAALEADLQEEPRNEL